MRRLVIGVFAVALISFAPDRLDGPAARPQDALPGPERAAQVARLDGGGLGQRHSREATPVKPP